jgi:xeroderma pigmentosum group C-complementing protein
VVSGVVVAAGHEDIVLDAWHAEEVIRLEKEATKKQKEILSRWKKFLVGLRIRKRIGLVYGAKENEKPENDVDGDGPSKRIA